MEEDEPSRLREQWVRGLELGQEGGRVAGSERGLGGWVVVEAEQKAGPWMLWGGEL